MTSYTATLGLAYMKLAVVELQKQNRNLNKIEKNKERRVVFIYSRDATKMANIDSHLKYCYYLSEKFQQTFSTTTCATWRIKLHCTIGLLRISHTHTHTVVNSSFARINISTG